MKFSIASYNLAARAARNLAGRDMNVTWTKSRDTLGGIFMDERTSDAELVKLLCEKCARARLGERAGMHEVARLAADMENYAREHKRLYRGGEAEASLAALAKWIEPELRHIVESAVNKAMAKYKR